MPRQLLISLLLVVTFSPRPLHGQLKAETKLSPLEVTTENSNAPPASSNKTIAVVLRKSLDASKLKAGETYIVEGGFFDFFRSFDFAHSLLHANRHASDKRVASVQKQRRVQNFASI